MGVKVATVLGARPQFIKEAPVAKAFSRLDIHEVVVHTGQHHDSDMSAVFFEELAIPEPDYHLGVHGGPHGEMTGRMLEQIEAVLVSEQPAAVVVYGDTNSTLAGALASVKLHIPVVHVEAGLRSFNRRMPEEVNRVVVDHVATLLLCPTRLAVDNLNREGVADGVQWVGDVMYDAALQMRARADCRSTILERLQLAAGEYAVATLHRAENTDGPAELSAVVSYLREQTKQGPVVLPLHPRTHKALASADVDVTGLTILPPLGYLDMTQLVAHSTLVLTDSGGLQKEAYFHRVPCITLRTETEWVETIEAGWNRLWQTDDWLSPRREIDDYGDGKAADRVAEAVLRLIG